MKWYEYGFIAATGAAVIGGVYYMTRQPTQPREKTPEELYQQFLSGGRLTDQEAVRMQESQGAREAKLRLATDACNHGNAEACALIPQYSGPAPARGGA